MIRMDYPGLTMLASTRLMPELLNAEIAKKNPAHLEKAINSSPKQKRGNGYSPWTQAIRLRHCAFVTGHISRHCQPSQQLPGYKVNGYNDGQQTYGSIFHTSEFLAFLLGQCRKRRISSDVA
jgi:hypothetical protein